MPRPRLQGDVDPAQPCGTPGGAWSGCQCQLPVNCLAGASYHCQAVIVSDTCDCSLGGLYADMKTFGDPNRLESRALVLSI